MLIVPWTASATTVNDLTGPLASIAGTAAESTRENVVDFAENSTVEALPFDPDTPPATPDAAVAALLAYDPAGAAGGLAEDAIDTADDQNTTVGTAQAALTTHLLFVEGSVFADADSLTTIVIPGSSGLASAVADTVCNRPVTGATKLSDQVLDPLSDPKDWTPCIDGSAGENARTLIISAIGDGINSAYLAGSLAHSGLENATGANVDQLPANPNPF